MAPTTISFNSSGSKGRRSAGNWTKMQGVARWMVTRRNNPSWLLSTRKYNNSTKCRWIVGKSSVTGGLAQRCSCWVTMTASGPVPMPNSPVGVMDMLHEFIINRFGTGQAITNAKTAKKSLNTSKSRPLLFIRNWLNIRHWLLGITADHDQNLPESSIQFAATLRQTTTYKPITSAVIDSRSRCGANRCRQSERQANRYRLRSYLIPAPTWNWI